MCENRPIGVNRYNHKFVRLANEFGGLSECVKSLLLGCEDVSVVYGECCQFGKFGIPRDNSGMEVRVVATANQQDGWLDFGHARDYTPFRGGNDRNRFRKKENRDRKE